VQGSEDFDCVESLNQRRRRDKPGHNPAEVPVFHLTAIHSTVSITSAA
jgi:hypothetical protein